MSWTDRSIILIPNTQMGYLTPRHSSISSQKARKGISLSKELKSIQRSNSPSFIKLTGKGKKPQIVQRREIKLIIKSRDDYINSHEGFSNENISFPINTREHRTREYMDAISMSKPAVMKWQGKAGQNIQNFAANKAERVAQRRVWPVIKLL